MPPDKPLTVAVTGAAGYIAGRLIEALGNDDRIDRIIGFDVRPPSVRAGKLVFDQIDVRDRELERRLAGCDVVVHLAFVMDPIKDEAKMRDINVNGSQNVFHSAAHAGVRKVVYTSSATVYGAHPDNDVPLTEESPLRANLDFSYPAHKLEVEYMLREFRKEFPEVVVTVYRPAIVFGPHVDNAWSRTLELPVLFGAKGYRPPIQFVHEDDVAAALAFAMFAELDGPYNLAADGWLDADEALAIVARRRIELAEPTAFALADALWDLGLSEAPAGMLHYLMHPWVLSTAKLAAAGFGPARTNAEALEAAVRAAHVHVRVGPARIRRKHMVRGLASAGLGVAVAGAWAARRARSTAA